MEEGNAQKKKSFLLHTYRFAMDQKLEESMSPKVSKEAQLKKTCCAETRRKLQRGFLKLLVAYRNYQVKESKK